MSYTPKGKGKFVARKRRHIRVRKRVFGSAQRPRLVVTRSNRHMVAQIINDEIGHTLVSASTLEAEQSTEKQTKVEAAREVGERIAKRALEAGIEAVVFDRGGNKYHGRVAAVADGARDGGLKL